MNLPSGFVLDHYRLEQVLGSPGAFGITYYATDLRNGRKVAVKELFPTDCMVRDPYGSWALLPRSTEDGLAFEEALRMFEEEAKVLLKLRHANIVQALDYFEAEVTRTAYLVMTFEPGYNLGHHLELQRPGRLSEHELLKLLDPLLDGLGAVHQCNFLHRDIKPSNIYITRENKPLLLDFGAARQIVVGRTRPLTMVLTPGFAPFEQYSKAMQQGPFTDVYAMGAVVYYAITGRIPVVAINRKTKDDYVPLAKEVRGSEYSTSFLEAVDWALSFRAEDRPQTLADWRSALHQGTRQVPPMVESTRFIDRLKSRFNHSPTAPPPILDPVMDMETRRMRRSEPQPVSPVFDHPGGGSSRGTLGGGGTLGESSRGLRSSSSSRSKGGMPGSVVLLLCLLCALAAGWGVWWWITR